MARDFATNGTATSDPSDTGKRRYARYYQGPPNRPHDALVVTRANGRNGSAEEVDPMAQDES